MIERSRSIPLLSRAISSTYRRFAERHSASYERSNVQTLDGFLASAPHEPTPRTRFKTGKNIQPAEEKARNSPRSFSRKMDDFPSVFSTRSLRSVTSRDPLPRGVASLGKSYVTVTDATPEDRCELESLSFERERERCFQNYYRSRKVKT